MPFMQETFLFNDYMALQKCKFFVDAARSYRYFFC